MMRDIVSHPLHPLGDQPPVDDVSLPAGVDLDSFKGTVHVEWDREAALERTVEAINS